MCQKMLASLRSFCPSGLSNHLISDSAHPRAPRTLKDVDKVEIISTLGFLTHFATLLIQRLLVRQKTLVSLRSFCHLGFSPIRSATLPVQRLLILSAMLVLKRAYWVSKMSILKARAHQDAEKCDSIDHLSVSSYGHFVLSRMYLTTLPI